MTDSGPMLDLEGAGDRIHLRPGDVDGVVARARQRTAHTRRTVSVLTAVAVVASIPVAQRILSPDEDETPVATSAGLARTDLGITWRRVEAKTSVTTPRGLSNGTPLYAVSSSPGERHVDGKAVSRVVWRSEDGIEWSAMSTLGPDLYLADLSAPDGRVYAVGTAPAQAVPAGRDPTLHSVDAVVAWSDDEGQRWQKALLPVDLPTPSPTRRGAVMGTAVASGAKGTVAVVVRYADLDVPALLPEGVTAPHGWATTDAGVDILGPKRDAVCPAGTAEEKPAPTTEEPGEQWPTYCRTGDEGKEMAAVTPQEAHSVKASYTWEQLGVRGDLLRAVRREPIVYFAPPGSTDFERVEVPATWRAVEPRLLAREDGFDLLIPQYARYDGAYRRYTVLRSADGRSWAEVDAPVERSQVNAVGVLGGRAAFVATDEQGGTLVVDDGTGGWRTAALMGATDPALADGRTLSIGNAAFGDAGVVVHALFIPARRDFDPAEVRHRLLVSRDGVTWDDIPLDSVVDERDANVTRITVTGEEIVLTVSLPAAGEPKGARRQATFVGSVA